MAYYYELTARHFRPYSEYPSSSTAWRNLITSNTYGTFINGYVYQWAPDGSTNRNSGCIEGYICFGNNENNSSFDVFFVATTDTYGMGPFMFNLGSGTSKAAQWAGTSGGIHYGVWKVGTISASSRNEAKTFNDFVLIALDNDPNNGYMSDESITISSALKNEIQSDTVKGASYPGCYDVTISFSVASTVTMGKTTVQATASLAGGYGGFDLTVLSGVPLMSRGSTTSLSWNAVLPYTLESRYNDNELRRTTNLQLTTTVGTDKPLFINSKWKMTGDNITASSNFVLQIDSSRVPSFTSVSGTKVSNHNSMYVMLMNGYDKITFAATVRDQSYPYENNYSNYAPRFALYCGDANLGNYNPASVSQSGNTITTTYSGTWGPITVNPPVALGVNQTFRIAYQDRFGRQASSNLTLTYNSSSLAYLRFYNYVNPTWGLTAIRVNSSGTPDDKNGTYIKITYNWALSLLDYSMSPHTGTNRPTLKITNNQDSTANNYTLTTESGSNTYTLSGKPLDKSYTFTAVLTDAAGRAYTLTAFVPSGEVFMDFKAGGSGLGIGMRSETAEQLDIGWNTVIHGNLTVTGTYPTGLTKAEVQKMIDDAIAGIVNGNNMKF